VTVKHNLKDEEITQLIQSKLPFLKFEDSIEVDEAQADN